MLLRIRKNKQITLPTRLCKQYHLEDGDLLEAEPNDDGTILLRPQKLIDASQAWYWTEAWQAKEKEADLSIERGEVVEFGNVEEAIQHLHDSRK
jgi:bifunctional DNA-binding transcriptional regulator/antitoxin component of YhaV-PrlF toxin-antitoxin module